MSITSTVESWNPPDGEVYSIQHYVIEFVSDLQQVFCFTGNQIYFKIAGHVDLDMFAV